jgi:hypothetical protein
MPIDPSIALGVRPLEVPNQLGQFAQMSQIQNAQNQNALAQYQLAAAQRAENQQNALAQALPNLDLSSAEGQRKLLGFGAPGLQILKTHRELEAQRATQKAQEATTLVKNLEAVDKTTSRFKDDLVNVTTPTNAVEWLARQYQDPVLGPVVSKMPFEQAVQQIPTEPKAFEEWRKRNNMGMEKYLTDTRAELNRLETGRHNLATERTAAGQLATSQGQLSVAQQRLGLERQKFAEPTFNAQAGGFIVPPSKENPGGGFIPATGIQAAKDQGAAVKALQSAGYDPTTGEDTISKLIKKSTSGGLEAAGASTLAFFGKSTEGRKAIAALEGTANQIATDLAGGKLGAGISNTDRDFIVAALGDVANPNKTSDERLAGWTAAKNRMMRAGLIPMPTEAALESGAAAVNESKLDALLKKYQSK